METTSLSDRRNFIAATAAITTSLLGFSGLNQSSMASDHSALAPESLAVRMRGTWWLLSREDRTQSGEKRIDPVLGADPLGILSYGNTHFAAQFMKLDRAGNTVNPVMAAGKNNTGAVGGYDAYFGLYEVNERESKVTQTLLGSINPANVGMTVTRELRVNGDMLTIQLETTTPDGESITRTLTWNRIG